MSTTNIFEHTNIQLKNGTLVEASRHLRGKIVVLYFSASWCSPCRQFTPIMKELSNQIQKTGTPIEVILMSKDFMRFQLDEYCKQNGCSWSRVQLRDPIIEKCMKTYNITEFPACLVVDEFGNRLDDDDTKKQVEVRRQLKTRIRNNLEHFYRDFIGIKNK